MIKHTEKEKNVLGSSFYRSSTATSDEKFLGVIFNVIANNGLAYSKAETIHQIPAFTYEAERHYIKRSTDCIIIFRLIQEENLFKRLLRKNGTNFHIIGQISLWDRETGLDKSNIRMGVYGKDNIQIMKKVAQEIIGKLNFKVDLSLEEKKHIDLTKLEILRPLVIHT